MQCLSRFKINWNYNVSCKLPQALLAMAYNINRIQILQEPYIIQQFQNQSKKDMMSNFTVHLESKITG